MVQFPIESCSSLKHHEDSISCPHFFWQSVLLNLYQCHPFNSAESHSRTYLACVSNPFPFPPSNPFQRPKNFGISFHYLLLFCCCIYDAWQKRFNGRKTDFHLQSQRHPVPPSGESTVARLFSSQRHKAQIIGIMLSREWVQVLEGFVGLIWLSTQGDLNHNENKPL